MSQNITHQFIGEMVAGLVFDGFYILSSAQIRKSRAGKPYLSGTLMDISGSINIVAWDYTGLITTADVGKVVYVDGEVGEYNGTPQVVCTVLELATEEDSDSFNLADLIPYAPINCQTAVQQMRRVLEGLEDEVYRNISLGIFDKFASLLSTLPAAKSVHHAFIGGWATHTLGMIILAERIYDEYHRIHSINRSLLMAGVFLHDIGKFREFQLSPFGLVADYSMEGKLIGHPVLGALIIENEAQKGAYPLEKVRQLQHIVLSHHGAPELGAATRPQTMEAEIINYLDGLNSRMDIYNAALSKTEEGAFSDYVRALDKRIYRATA